MTPLLTPGPLGPVVVGVVVVVGEVAVVVALVVVAPVPPELGGAPFDPPELFVVPGLVLATGVGVPLEAPLDGAGVLTATGPAGALPPLGVGAAGTEPLLGTAVSDPAAGAEE
ncbi:MAG TPA: hypothetical protein VGQ38_15790 [Gaiellaceae bacterium]|nr:hypothetical protein [Gaiellaceae bacterium]